ncbi:MAG: SDR family oxidoreductase [Flavobacteriia bacterium]|nr:SDR family oxidoreductase [Flavobacteriia bacterium]
MPKIVFITGASSGIGKAIGEFLLSKGYIVYGSSRSPKKYPDTRFKLLELDVKDNISIEKAIAKIVLLEGKIDVLINNAGVGITGPIEETSEDEIKNVLEINYYGPLRVIKAVLPQMREHKSGLIINITSIAAYMGLPYRGFYSASKSALDITTEALRMETKSFGIQFTNVAPGDFATNIAAGRYHAPLLDNSPYKIAYGNTLNLMNSHVDAGKNPLLMGKAILKIIETENPKVRYTVGNFMQKFSITLKNLLPGTWYENLLMKHYKLKK